MIYFLNDNKILKECNMNDKLLTLLKLNYSVFGKHWREIDSKHRRGIELQGKLANHGVYLYQNNHYFSLLTAECT